MTTSSIIGPGTEAYTLGPAADFSVTIVGGECPREPAPTPLRLTMRQRGHFTFGAERLLAMGRAGQGLVVAFDPPVVPRGVNLKTGDSTPRYRVLYEPENGSPPWMVVIDGFACSRQATEVEALRWVVDDANREALGQI